MFIREDIIHMLYAARIGNNSAIAAARKQPLSTDYG